MPQTNKRRRGSTVPNLAMKDEDEDSISNPTPKHPKQSPRIGPGGRGGGPTGGPSKRIRSDS